MSETRRVRVRALAKINLDLRVLAKRPDQFHELRTVFQTVSLADTLEIDFTPGRKTAVVLADDAGIPDNLVLRAAALVMETAGAKGRVEMRLKKKIPAGAGLGGGSSDAAAVLLALPVLTGRRLELSQLAELGGRLGSDVPFFLLGGAAVGLGRGTELYPLPDLPARPGVLLAPGVHVSTAEAYRRLSPRLTTKLQENKIVSFQSHVWDLDCGRRAGNDFEDVVFEQHPRLAALKRRLVRAGADPAMMTGSGSALFGMFHTREEVSRAMKSLGDEKAIPITLVSRARYRSLWRRALQAHSTDKLWPPLSRYAR